MNITFSIMIVVLFLAFVGWRFVAHRKDMMELERMESEHDLLKHQFDNVKSKVVVDDAISRANNSDRNTT